MPDKSPALRQFPARKPLSVGNPPPTITRPKEPEPPPRPSSCASPEKGQRLVQRAQTKAPPSPSSPLLAAGAQRAGASKSIPKGEGGVRARRGGGRYRPTSARIRLLCQGRAQIPRLHPSRQSPGASGSQLAGRQTKHRGEGGEGGRVQVQSTPRLPARSHPPFSYRRSMLLLGCDGQQLLFPNPETKGEDTPRLITPIVRPAEKAAPEAAPARRRGDRPAPSPRLRYLLTKPADAFIQVDPSSVD